MYKKMFQYFIERYKVSNNQEYNYIKNRLGLELMKIKRLKLKYNDFVDFINWLYIRKKLSSINFLATQLNDYHASAEYQSQQVIKETILHQDIMAVRMKIINKCDICERTGFINKTHQCKCMKKFLKIRDRMRKKCD